MNHPSTKWDFYLTDDDRSTGWTNHGTVLQHVCSGYGETPAKAWDEALHSDRGIPEGYDDTDLPDVAVRALDHWRDWKAEPAKSDEYSVKLGQAQQALTAAVKIADAAQVNADQFEAEFLRLALCTLADRYEAIESFAYETFRRDDGDGDSVQLIADGSELDGDDVQGELDDFNPSVVAAQLLFGEDETVTLGRDALFNKPVMVPR